MKTYIVGGAVRDALLGMPVQDRDWVVVGATPEDMLAQGFRPVGKDFPVFLHPQTQEEYALARTERKSAPGYRGFVFHTSPDVTLEQDLVRRDLTINAMARADDGSVVDPFGGQRDIHNKVFRHVSDAFLEDPVRILRLARFAARFPDFTVAPETVALMRSMVAQGEVDALVAERVWQELARGLMEQRPSRMFSVLRECGALARILPELEQLFVDGADERGEAAMLALDYGAVHGVGLCERFAALAYAMTPLPPLCERLKVPNECRDLAVMTARELATLERADRLDPDALVALFGRCDALRKPQRFEQMLQACACIARSRECAHAVRLRAALAAARAVDAGAIAATCSAQPARIPAAVLAARVAAVQVAIQEIEH
jgi:tRNA nucleotidyltransferase (CCA-adding enzyme)